MLHDRFANWLETHWVIPAYSGWLLGSLAIFFFAAATNTMAGWLYVISGIILAVLMIAALLPQRALRGVRISRGPIAPVSVGDCLTIEVLLVNQTASAKTLLQVQDQLPNHLLTTAQPITQAIEVIPAHETYRWVYQVPTQHRGVYPWYRVSLRTAAPLGLFWCQRDQSATATAIVYPTVLPLQQCPLVDQMGQDLNAQRLSLHHSFNAPEGITRTLRPYRWGDPIRQVHWRSSARYGELRIRELETYTGGQDWVIALDSRSTWQSESFEQAVIAAASLYFYALKQTIQVSIWTAATGLVKGDRAVLQTLAATQYGEVSQGDRSSQLLPNVPLLWLTQHSTSLSLLPKGSRYLFWLPPEPPASSRSLPSSEYPGLVIQPEQSLQLQLQAAKTV